MWAWSPFRTWNWRLSVDPTMNPPAVDGAPLNSWTLSAGKLPLASRAGESTAVGAADPSSGAICQPAGISSTSRRKRSTASGSGVTILTWVMRSIGVLLRVLSCRAHQERLSREADFAAFEGAEEQWLRGRRAAGCDQ